MQHHSVVVWHKAFYYITFNYMLCNIPPALLNNRLALSISGPISNITVGPGPITLIGPGPTVILLFCNFIS